MTLDGVSTEGEDSEAKVVDATAKVLPGGEGFARGGAEGSADEEENDGFADEAFESVPDAILVEEGKLGSWFSVSDHLLSRISAKPNLNQSAILENIMM